MKTVNIFSRVIKLDTFKANLIILSVKENDRFTVKCPTLKVFGYSAFSENDAIEDFKKDLRLFVSYHNRNNTLQKTLDKFGVQYDRAD